MGRDGHGAGGDAGDGAEGVQAGADRATGATFLIVPEDVAEQTTDRRPLRVNVPVDPRRPRPRCAPPRSSAKRSTPSCSPPGVARDGATDALVRFSETLNLPVATTFLGKGVFLDDHPNALGTIGFMVRDYANFGFDDADVVVAAGYDLVEYAGSMEPSPRQTDPPRASNGGRGRRRLRARGRRPGRHRESLDASRPRRWSSPRRDREEPGSASCARSLRPGRATSRSSDHSAIVHDVRRTRSRRRRPL